MDLPSPDTQNNRQLFEELVRKDERIRILSEENESLNYKISFTQDELKKDRVAIANLEAFRTRAEKVQRFIMAVARASILLACTLHFMTTQFETFVVDYNYEEKGIEVKLYGFDPNLTAIPFYVGFLSTIMVPYDVLYKELDSKQVLDAVLSVTRRKKK